MATQDEQDELPRLLFERLYGELDEAGQRALDARLAVDPAARRELERLERTRMLTRQALQRPLADAPPPRVRATVLEAARRAAEARRQPTQASGRERDTVTVMDRVVASLRRPWFVPALVGAAAITLFVVAREGILAPDAQRAFESASPSAPPTAPPVPAEHAAAAREQATEPTRAFAEPPPAVPQAARPHVASAPKVDRGVARRSRKPAKEQLADSDGALGGVSSGGAPVAEAAGAERDEQRRYARPPRGWGAGSAAAPAPTEAPRPAAAAAPAAAAPSPAREADASRKRSSAPTAPTRAADLAMDAESAPAASAANEEGADGIRGESREALIARADRAFDERRWADARRAYAELIRRHPRDEAAARWRERLAASERAVRAR